MKKLKLRINTWMNFSKYILVECENFIISNILDGLFRQDDIKNNPRSVYKSHYHSLNLFPKFIYFFIIFLIITNKIFSVKEVIKSIYN